MSWAALKLRTCSVLSKWALKSSGAAVLRDGVYLLPASATHTEIFNKVEQDVSAAEGTAYCLQIADAYPFAELFNRNDDYQQLTQEIQLIDNNQAVSELNRQSRKLRQTFNALVAIDFLEHISKDDVMELLRQAHRVLAKGGRFILRYPNGDSPLVGMNLFNDITHVWTYTPNCLDTLARMHGFARTQLTQSALLNSTIIVLCIIGLSNSSIFSHLGSMNSIGSASPIP